VGVVPRAWRAWLRRGAAAERRAAEPPAAQGDASPAELARAARLLSVRSRREVAGALAGAYRSAFRGGGVEFEESRPYVPGDDLRTIDWNATARSGEPYVKRFREERDETLLLLLDVSASMRFSTAGSSKAALAARAAALLAAAAGQARDRVGLVSFDAAVRRVIPPARGAAHTWRVIRAAVEAGAAAAGGTGLLCALSGAAALRGRRRAIAFLLSDFRDPALLASPRLAAELASAARRHDLVAGVLHDPREDELPDAGSVRFADPEAPRRTLVFPAGSARARSLYRAACLERRRSLELVLRQAGADVVWLRTDHDPLRALARFFAERTGRVRLAS
jgi:uncharacterized protein (DUF58 family)